MGAGAGTKINVRSGERWIIGALKREWPFRDADIYCGSVENTAPYKLTASALGPLATTESRAQAVESIEQAVWAGNGGMCHVEVEAAQVTSADTLSVSTGQLCHSQFPYIQDPLGWQRCRSQDRITPERQSHTGQSVSVIARAKIVSSKSILPVVQRAAPFSGWLHGAIFGLVLLGPACLQ